MTAPVLQIIIGSTRPERVGPAVARWFYALAVAHGDFEVELVDLADVNLPLLDEPFEAVERKYQFEHTKRWSETVARADAFVLVVPEYNHSFNAATKNALDYLSHEWRYKATGLVSYGGAARGTRAVEQLKPVLNALKMVHAGDLSVALQTAPVVDEVFRGNDSLMHSAQRLLDELARMTPALRALRPSGTLGLGIDVAGASNES